MRLRRRTLLQSALGIAAGLPIPAVRAWAQTVTFPGDQERTLKELAATVLPASLGRAKTDAVADQFARWVREYRAGEAMSPGYGNPRVRYKGPSPAPKYMTQLAQLAADPLAQPDMSSRRNQIGQAIKTAGIRDLSPVPEGNYIAADLMSFYFFSPEANDLVYNAAIGKDMCRTIKNSSSVPAPLKGGSANAAL